MFEGTNFLKLNLFCPSPLYCEVTEMIKKRKRKKKKKTKKREIKDFALKCFFDLINYLVSVRVW